MQPVKECLDKPPGATVRTPSFVVQLPPVLDWGWCQLKAGTGHRNQMVQGDVRTRGLSV